jgi:hypothetical protein
LIKEVSMGTRQEMEASLLKFWLEVVPSTLKIAPGGEIKFPRPVLVIQNVGPDPAKVLISHASIFQEGGMPQEVTETLNKKLIDRFIPPEDTLRWDLYDLLIAEHPGVASKVHLFGYKAVLNWWFELSVKTDCRLSDGSLSVQMPLFRAKFRWNASKPALEKVDLSIDPLST